MRRLACLLFALASLSLSPLHSSPPSFNRDIRPILSDHCFSCHGPDEKHRKADLRLDTPTGAFGKGESGSIAIVAGNWKGSEIATRLHSADRDELMPPPKANKPLQPEQIALLQKWVESGAKWEGHWAFAELKKPQPPLAPQLTQEQARWAQNPLDQLVLARLLHDGLTPASPADPTTLARRISLDLTGLPLSPPEVADFIQASKTNRQVAVEALVDRLLASPSFGERMAWDWMEVARYADSNGYEHDADRTSWPWRDWVVKAFNENLPYDQFTLWQLAGDLLPDSTPEQKLATAFLRNHPINGEGGTIPEENRVNYAMDMAETTGTAWLGLTFNCCRCHDHKFDALAQRDYYSLFAFFNQSPVDGSGGNPQTPPVIIPPGSNAKVMIMEERKTPRPTFILEKGLYNKPGPAVEPATPAKLTPFPTDAPRNRLGLARWIVAPENPLTPRVVANRFWQMIFGVGLVKSSDDFGVQGEFPKHPDLLDWLASDFRDSGWNTKKLLRTILTSATYQQSSASTPALTERDPENRLLARGPRFRLPSAILRDQALAVSGLLVNQVGGRPVRPYQPRGIWEEASFGHEKYLQGKGPDLYRRSLYTFWRRIIGPTMFFDTSGRSVCTVKPTRTNTPLHALATLNDPTYVEAARTIAQKALLNAQSPEDRLSLTFNHILLRSPKPAESLILLAGLTRTINQFTAHPENASKLLSTGDSPHDPSLNPAEHAAWTTLALTILNFDETLNKE